MRVQLLVSEWCVPCRSAEEIWQTVSQRKEIAFEVVDAGQPEGREIVSKLGVRTVPSTVIDGVLAHLGVPTLDEAMQLTASASDRAEGATQSHYVGLTMESTSSWQLVSAGVYLVLAGVALILGGGIDGDPAWRGAALHGYGLGFIVFFVFGLGEHMLPRFTGAPIRGGAAAWAQVALTHLGTLILAAGLAAQSRSWALAGGIVAWFAFVVFSARVLTVLRHFQSGVPDADLAAGAKGPVAR